MFAYLEVKSIFVENFPNYWLSWEIRSSIPLRGFFHVKISWFPSQLARSLASKKGTFPSRLIPIIGKDEAAFCLMQVN